MKNHELLDMIGEVNEDYVLEAGNNVTQPRFRWTTLAVCAACAALVLAAYPVYRAVNPPLHRYTVVEGGGVLDTQGDIKAPAGGSDIPVPAPVPGGAFVGDDSGQESGADGVGCDVPGQDAPAQEAAQAQYDNFMKNSGLASRADCLPEWCGGLWIDNGCYPEAKLTVAIVDGFRTAELEARIQEWCGGEVVVFKDVKYSWSYLDKLMGPIADVLDGKAINAGFGVNEMENCLGVDLYSDQDIPKQVLAELARLDPDGDAIRVRVFTEPLSLADELLKGPALEEPAADPDACPTPIDGSEYAIPEFHPDYNVTFKDGLPANNNVILEGE